MGKSTLKVRLVRHTPEPEETVAMAAKLCYSPVDIDGLQERISEKDQRNFIKKLIDMGHMSPVEHVSFTFAIEGISRACSHQLVRHRLASYSQQSQRYVSHGKDSARVGQGDVFPYIIPPSINGDEEARNIFENFMAQAQKVYDLLADRLKNAGIEGEEANQDARFVLPNASETKIVVTMNARELLHFFEQRCCNRAQWEIHALADEMLHLAREAAPALFSLAGPGCVAGPCVEGEMTCGNVDAVRRKYKILQ